MYTRDKTLGKFEGSESEHVARVLYDICAISGHDEEISFYEHYTDWYGLIKGKKHWFIVHEDNNGFFTYDIYTIEEGKSLWSGLLSEHEDHISKVYI